VDSVFRDGDLPIECDKVAGADRREGYDIETGLKWGERAVRLAIVRVNMRPDCETR
jgi:hypothetical protein